MARLVGMPPSSAPRHSERTLAAPARMKPVMIIGVILTLLALLGFGGAYYVRGIARSAKTIIVMNRLMQASAELKKNGTFTNDVPEFCQIYPHTNQYTVRGKEYYCVLAAKSPLFQKSGFMAVTTNDVLLWIDPVQGATPMTGPDSAQE